MSDQTRNEDYETTNTTAGLIHGSLICAPSRRLRCVAYYTMPKLLPKLLRVDEAAVLLGVSRDTIRRLIGRGKLHGVKIQHCLRVTADGIERFIAQGGAR